MKEHLNDNFIGLDIDWFSIDAKNNIALFASGGGLVPQSIRSESRDLLAAYFRALPELNNNELIISSQLENFVSFESSFQKDRYLEDFVLMAKKGIYVYDRTNVSNFSDTRHHLVVIPGIKLNIQDLPEEIFSLLRETRYPGVFDDASIIDVNDLNVRSI